MNNLALQSEPLLNDFPNDQYVTKKNRTTRIRDVKDGENVKFLNFFGGCNFLKGKYLGFCRESNSQCESECFFLSKKIRVSPSAEIQSEDSTEPLPNIKCDLNQEKLKTERESIRQALAKVGGRLTQAASLLE
jgi:hypothetical protein